VDLVVSLLISRSAGAGTRRLAKAWRRGLLITLSCVAASMLWPATGSAHVVDSYCQPDTGDFCYGVIEINDRIKLKISTFSFTGRYELCVRPSRRARTCHRFRLHRHRTTYDSSVNWGGHFPNHLHGRFAVTWSKSGTKLGPALHFRH
jgi:hypothetical protein